MSEDEKRMNGNEDDLLVLSVDESEEEHSGEHHHHRHHSRTYYWYRRKKHKIKKFLRKHKAFVPVSVTVLVLLVAFAAIYGGIAANSRVSNNSITEITAQTESIAPQLTINLPAFDEPQLLVPAKVADYANSPELTDIDAVLAGLEDNTRLDEGLSVKLVCSVTNMPSTVSVTESTLIVSEHQDFSDAMTYDDVLKQGSATLRFLKTGTTYFYRVTASFSNGTVLHGEGQFLTAKAPRMLSVDGVVNVRDIGGWETVDGKAIRQGLLYRGSEMDGKYKPEYKITDAGIADMHTYLGIVSDFDLRKLSGDVPEQSALGATTKHFVYGMNYYTDTLASGQTKAVKDIFSDLADESNYPVYMHCTYGLDRTGTLCYILEAMLGLSNEDLIKEYELSGFCFSDLTFRTPDSEFSKFVAEFDKLEGATTQEKAENFLLSCGVTKQEMEQIKDILLEE